MKAKKDVTTITEKGKIRSQERRNLQRSQQCQHESEGKELTFKSSVRFFNPKFC